MNEFLILPVGGVGLFYFIVAISSGYSACTVLTDSSCLASPYYKTGSKLLNICTSCFKGLLLHNTREVVTAEYFFFLNYHGNLKWI